MGKRLFRRNVMAALVPFLVLTLVLAGCGATPAPTAPAAEPTQEAAPPPTEAPPPPTEAPASAEKVTIRGIANDAYTRLWQEELVVEFNKHYPNIEVIIDGIPYVEMLPKEMLELTSGSVAYDFLVTDDPWLPQLASTGLLADLKTDLASSTDPEYDWDDFHPAPLAAGEWQGIQYGVPVRSNLLLMFYNRTLFSDAGLDADAVLEGADWAAFQEALAQLVRDTNEDGDPDVWGFATYFSRDQLTPTIWQSIMNSNGGQLMDDSLHPVFNDQVGVDALQTHIDLGKFGPPGIEAYWFTDTLEAFRQAKVAVMFNWGSVYRGVAVDPTTTTLTPEQIGVAPMPGGTACPDGSAHRGVWVGTIPKDAPNKEAAWQFLQWITSKEGEGWSIANIGSFPARVSTLTSEPSEAWQGPVFQAILDGYDAIACGKMWRPRLPDSDAVQQILALHHSRAVLGEVTPEEALNDAAQEVEELLSEKGYYDQ